MPDPDDAATDDASPVAEAVKESLSPTAPGQSDASGVVVDLPAVVPPTSTSPARLTGVAVAAGLGFAALTVTLARQGTAIPAIDSGIHDWVVTNRSDLSVSIARMITWGGATVVTLPALVVVGAAALRGRRPARTRLGAGVLLAGVASVGVYVGLTINSWVGRERPPIADWAGAAGGPSFPSGHTTSATLFAASCAWALASRVPPGRPRAALWSAAVMYALAVGWSRVWLGVHWPTDVLGSWLYAVGWSSLAVAAVVLARRRWPRPSVTGAGAHPSPDTGRRVDHPVG